jgi:hypothetical protein
MNHKEKKAFGIVEKVFLAVVVLVTAFHFLFWQEIRKTPLISFSLLALLALFAAGYWVWRNYRLVEPEKEKQVPIWEKLENIIYTLFVPSGYDIISLPSVDGENIGWAVLRDPLGINIILQYMEVSVDEPVRVDRLRLLSEKMNREGSLKGISLTTGFFNEESIRFARKQNILTKDSDQLLEMIKKSEENTQADRDFSCRYCGSKLEESREISNYMVCPNPDCRKVFSLRELSEEKKRNPRNIKSITITCYNCNRPVELDTTMSGLMECPYEDCSWIINVDNELLALKGGLDKKASERLAEIKCPKCDRLIKVPADAEGLMECPCEEKWIIDVGAALGERAQAQVAEGAADSEKTGEADNRQKKDSVKRKEIEYQPVTPPGLKTASPAGILEEQGEPGFVSRIELKEGMGFLLEVEKSPAPSPETQGKDENLIDCPGCGAGVPQKLDKCPVCGTLLQNTASLHTEGPDSESEEVTISPSVSEITPQKVVHKHAYLAVSTPGLLIFFAVSITAFLLFVYFVAR